MTAFGLADIAASEENATAWWGALERQTEEGFDKASKIMQETLHFAPAFDEVALMVPDAVKEYFLLEAAIKNGWAWTNAAIDHVATGPIPSSYSVHYSFLTRPDKSYRVEVMRLLGGISPLHLPAMNEDIVNVHWSFKCPDADWYEEVFEEMQIHKWRLAQGCESTYGRFSYWLPPTHTIDAPSTYIKPRVNLRDSRTAAENAEDAGAQA